MLPNLQAVHYCKEFLLVDWPHTLATIQLLAFLGNWPSILHERFPDSKVSSIHIHLKGLVKLKEH
jgi:hypothetical protein